jgi:hypothetical protein
MRAVRTFSFLTLFLLCAAGGFPPRAALAQEIENWSAPPTWSPPRAAGIGTMSTSSPLPFIPITPCRVADTRGNGAPIQGGIFTNSQSRNWTVAGVCGVVGGAAAVSVNFTVTGSPPTIPQGAFLLAFATGDPPPPTAIMTYGPTQTISNAAVVPLSAAAGQMTVNVSHSTHVIMDVNGYYAAAGVGADNTFLGRNAGNFTMTGESNTGVGHGALSANTAGDQNTAVGASALSSNTSGDGNTAVGFDALKSVADGSGNVAVGWESLQANVSGFHNTAVGIGSLLNNTGNRNTALGYLALSTAITNDNVAIGYNALGAAGGGSNIAIGSGAGALNTAGGFNMYLGNEGVATESGTIRIGSGIQHTRLFVAGVLVSPITGQAVLISNTGQLGIAVSSARYKEDVRDMGEATDRLLKLRPVSFRYKGHADDPVQFGLIAEEVEKVLPELVVKNSAGEPETVMYHEMPAMLLNEIQKQQKQIDSQSETIGRQQAEIDVLKEELRRLETRLSDHPRGAD